MTRAKVSLWKSDTSCKIDAMKKYIHAKMSLRAYQTPTLNMYNFKVNTVLLVKQNY